MINLDLDKTDHHLNVTVRSTSMNPPDSIIYRPVETTLSDSPDDNDASLGHTDVHINSESSDSSSSTINSSSTLVEVPFGLVPPEDERVEPNQGKEKLD